MPTESLQQVSHPHVEPIVAEEPGRAGVAVFTPVALAPNGPVAPLRYQSIYGPPRTLFGALAQLLRVSSAVALTMPAVVGSVLAWWSLDRFDPITFAFTVAGLLCSTLGLNVLAEFNDYRYSKLPEAKYLDDPIFAGSNLINTGLIEKQFAIGSGAILVAIGILCSLWLVLLVGWPMLFFMSLSFLLLTLCTIPPIRQRYLGWGIGEVGLFVGLGVLPIVGSFYAQTRTLTWLPLRVAIPFGLLAVLVFLSYNLLHQRRDWLLRKRTLVVVLRERRTLNLTTMLSLSVFTALLLLVMLSVLPLWALLGLGAMPVAFEAFKQVRAIPLMPDHRYHLHTSIVRGTIWTGILLSLSLWLDKTL